MSLPAPYSIAREPMPDHEQKQAALSYLNEAWAETRAIPDLLWSRQLARAA